LQYHHLNLFKPLVTDKLRENMFLQIFEKSKMYILFFSNLNLSKLSSFTTTKISPYLHAFPITIFPPYVSSFSSFKLFFFSLKNTNQDSSAAFDSLFHCIRFITLSFS